MPASVRHRSDDLTDDHDVEMLVREAEYYDSEILAEPSAGQIKREMDVDEGNQEDEYNEDVEIEARLSGFIEEEEDDAVLYGRMERNGETHGRARSESPLTPPPSSPPRGTRQAKTNAREKLSLNTNDSDDESDLTDLEEDDDLGDIELKDSSSAPPTKLKAKAKGGSKPDKKTKTKKKSKGKGKAKAKAKTSRQAYSDSEDDAQPKPKVKKQILAKATRWNDIPDWGDSDRCQLLEMPTEILDLMFAIRPELKAQDYVALAGTCKFFRHHLDEPFFKALSFKRKSNIIMYPLPIRTDQDILAGKRPFTRDIPDWRVPRPLKTTKKAPVLGAGRFSRATTEMQVKPTHYTPRGERSTWTEAQYTVYKEEKSHFREEEWKNRKPELKLIAKELLEAEKRSQSTIDLGYQNRWVLGRVPGRGDGQPPIEKDEKGLPLIVKVDSSDERDQSPHSETSEEGRISESNGEKRKRETDDDQVGLPESSRRTSRKRTKGNRGEIWTVPESSGDESGHDEFAYMAKHGYTVVHDFWPSASRIGASKSVSKDRISKTDALRTYKVTEAELLTLSHVLVPNRMGGKNPTQLYFTAAVESLAFRAHGGPSAHDLYVKTALRREEDRVTKRVEKEIQAKKDGTYVHKRKSRPGPHWAYCCPPDPKLCYCEDCWDGECDCHSYRYCSICGGQHRYRRI